MIPGTRVFVVVMFLFGFVLTADAAVTLPLPALYNLCDIVNIIGEWNCVSGCRNDYNGDGRITLADIVYVINRWKGGSSCAAPVGPRGDWSITLDGSTQVCPGTDGTYTVVVSFSGSAPVSQFVIQGDAPKLGRGSIVPDKFQMQTAPSGWSAALCQFADTASNSFFSCQGGPAISPGSTMRIVYAIRNNDAAAGIYPVDISTADSVTLLRITQPLMIDMVCGRTTTTTVPATTTAPPVLSWMTSIAGPDALCGVTRANYSATIVLTSGKEDHFLIRAAIVSDPNAVLLFTGNVAANAPSLLCFFSADRLSWRCDGPVQGPLTITISFALANSAPSTGSMRFNILVGRRDDDEADIITNKALTATATC